MSTKHVSEPVDRAGDEREAMDQKTSSQNDGHGEGTVRSAAQGLLLIDGENGAACTAEGCKVSFGKEN